MDLIKPEDFMVNLQGCVESILTRSGVTMTILVKNECEYHLVKQLLLMRIGSDWMVNVDDIKYFTDAIGCTIRTNQGQYFRIMYTDNQNALRGLTTSVFTTFKPSEDFINCIEPVISSCRSLMFFCCIDENFAE